MTSALLRYGTILLAALGFFMITQVVKAQKEKSPPQSTEPPVSPAQKPFQHAVAATGIIEALSENVSLGAPIAGLVSEVSVKVNQTVKKGDVVFSLDDRDLQAEETSAKAQAITAQASVVVSNAQLEKVRIQLERITRLKDSGAVSSEDFDNRQAEFNVAEAQLKAAQASLESSQASLKRLTQLRERLVVRAPRDGTILQVNIRPGEYLTTSPKAPAVVLGDLDRFQIRADIDEQNAIRIRQDQKAEGYLKGDPKVKLKLEFSRIEPYVIPKVSLTGASTERVDTRVLQVIYTFARAAGDPPLYVGQQVDLFIEAPESR
jgi:HlyD family secretion protein